MRIYTSSKEECDAYLLARKKVDEVLQYFSDNCPWMTIGFSEELKETWDSNPEELIKTISSYSKMGLQVKSRRMECKID